MKIRLRNKGKVFAVDEPVSIEVLDAAGALLAVVLQRDANNVQILTPGDSRFDTYAAVNRMATSVAAVLHAPDPTSGLLRDQLI